MDLAIESPTNLRINKHVIYQTKSKELLYTNIYIQPKVDVETMKTYIEILDKNQVNWTLKIVYRCINPF